MDPVTMLAVGAGISVLGQLRQGMSAKAASEFNVGVMGEGIKEAEIRANIIEDKIRREKRRTRGIQTARYMKAGVKLEGTPLEVLADTAAQYEEDVAINDYNKRVTIAKLKMGIEAEKIAGREAVTASILSAAGTGFKAAGMMYAPSPSQTTYNYYGYWGK